MKKPIITKFLGLLIAFALVFGSLSPVVTHANTEKINYIALGDSLAAGQTPYFQWDKGFTGYISEHFEEFGVLASYTNDFALPAYTTGQVLADIVENKEINGITLQETLKNANLVSVTAGANDLLREVKIDKANGTITYDPLKVMSTVAKIQSNLTSIVDEIKTYNPEAAIYLTGYYNAFPYLPTVQQEQIKEVLKGLNGIIQQVAVENGATFVSMDGIFDERTRFYLPNLNDIHPSLSGYEKMSEQFINVYDKENKNAYDDVPVDFWAYNQIHYLAHQDIMDGLTDMQFSPNDALTRADAAQALFNSIIIDKSYPPNPGFKDIDESHEAYLAIAKLTQLGIFDKRENFNPDDTLKRSQMAKILTLAFKLEVTKQSAFTDVTDSHWAKAFVDALLSSKVTTGYPDNTYKPEAKTTRAQFAAFLVRSMEIEK